MERINFYIPKKLLEALRKRQRETGLSVAEQIRQAIEAHLRHVTRRKEGD